MMEEESLVNLIFFPLVQGWEVFLLVFFWSFFSSGCLSIYFFFFFSIQSHFGVSTGSLQSKGNVGQWKCRSMNSNCCARDYQNLVYLAVLKKRENLIDLINIDGNLQKFQRWSVYDDFNGTNPRGQARKSRAKPSRQSEGWRSVPGSGILKRGWRSSFPPPLILLSGDERNVVIQCRNDVTLKHWTETCVSEGLTLRLRFSAQM